MDNQDGNKKGHTSRMWSKIPALSKDFIDMVLGEIAKCGYQGTSLKPQSWSRIKEALQEKYHLEEFTQKKIKNHWDILKKKYVAWRYLLNKTGHGFNPETGFFSFPPEVWDDIIKKNKECAIFRKAPLEHRDELSKIFEGVLASGDMGETPFTDDGGLSQNVSAENANVDVGETEESPIFDDYFEGVTFTPTYDNSPATPVTPAADQGATSTLNATRSSTGKKNKRERSPDKIDQLIVLVTEQVKRREAQLEEETSYSFGECMNMLTAMSQYMVIPDDVFEHAMVKLSEKYEYRKAFLDIPEAHKLTYLRGLARRD